MSTERLKFVFLNGKGSSGKDTQAEALVAGLSGAVRISTGDIYRGARTPDGNYGEFHYLLAPFIESVDNGGYFPDELMMEIVLQVIEKQVSENNSLFIFTGFPRTLPQLRGIDCLLDTLREKYEVEALFVYLAVLDTHSKDRAQSRRNKAVVPRPDDESEVVSKRLGVFHEKTKPMIRELIKENRLCIVRANRGVEKVNDDLMLVISVND